MDIRPGSTLEGPNGQTITVQRVLGSGGFGQVLVGELPNGALVAVKTVLTTMLAENELRALQNEIKLAGEIDDPNVVRVLHVNDGTAVQGQPPYLVMELVPGGTLQALIESRRDTKSQFGIDELRAMYRQLASAMRAINSKLVHRDIKPGNILIDAGVLKVSDFGLAKLANAATRSHTWKGWGTLPYMAPEAFDGTANTVAMDVYAMGVVFYELAVLRLPIVPMSGDALAWARAHLTQAPADIRAARTDLPLDLQQLILQMLQKDAARRPSDWSELANRLEAGGAAPSPGTPDVSRLVEKATARFQEQMAATAQRLERRQRREERRAVLELAAREPMDLFRRVVDAFNDSTSVGRLTYRQDGLTAEIIGPTGQEVRIEIQIGEDIEVPPDGVVRMLGVVELLSPPSPSERQHYNPDSFSGFNLAYWVPNAAARYGSWRMYRFEFNPLMSRLSPVRWFALGLSLLPRQMKLLRAMGEYQHETSDLTDTWFQALLVPLL